MILAKWHRFPIRIAPTNCAGDDEPDQPPRVPPSAASRSVVRAMSAAGAAVRRLRPSRASSATTAPHRSSACSSSSGSASWCCRFAVRPAGVPRSLPIACCCSDASCVARGCRDRNWFAMHLLRFQTWRISLSANAASHFAATCADARSVSVTARAINAISRLMPQKG